MVRKVCELVFNFVTFLLFFTRTFDVIKQIVPADENRNKVEAPFFGEELVDLVTLCSRQGENVEVGESQFSALAIRNKQISSE